MGSAMSAASELDQASPNKLWSDEALCCVQRRDFNRTRGDDKAENRKSQDRKSQDRKSQDWTSRDLFGNAKATTNVPSSKQGKHDFSSLVSSKKNLFESHHADVKGRPRSQGSSTPVWLRDPEPPAGWTSEKQRVLLSLLDEEPMARKHPDHLKKVFEKTHRLVPDKTIDEVEKCYRHLQSKRIAFFGKEGDRQSPPAGKVSRAFP
jgi:hypothetical protein